MYIYKPLHKCVLIFKAQFSPVKLYGRLFMNWVLLALRRLLY